MRLQYRTAERAAPLVELVDSWSSQASWCRRQAGREPQPLGELQQSALTPGELYSGGACFSRLPCLQLLQSCFAVLCSYVFVFAIRHLVEVIFFFLEIDSMLCYVVLHFVFP